ncbi:MAG: type 4a pilus biogenesis protein PilO [Mariprofundaceae bacterium]
MSLSSMDLSALNGLRPILPFPLVYKAGVLAAAFVLALAGYTYFGWMPLQEEIQAERAKVEKERILLKKNRALAKNLPKKMKEYAELEKQLKVALNMLPKKSQIPDLLESVSWAGKDSGLEFTEFRPKKEVAKKFYAEVPVNLDVNGSYLQLLTFLRRVGELSRIVDVKNLQLSRDKGSQLKVKGQAVTYRFLEKEVTGKGKKKGRK